MTSAARIDAAQGSGAAHRPAAALLGVALLLGGALLLALAASASGASASRVGLLLVLAPLAEEAVFRAGLHEALLRRAWAPASANLATALAFALAHVALRGDATALLVALPALLIGAVYGARRKLRDCVMLHAAMNAIWLIWTLAGPAGP